MNAWRIEIANLVMKGDGEEALLMCRLMDTVVAFTERVLRADDADLELRVAEALTELPDDSWPEPKAEQPTGPFSSALINQEDDQERARDDCEFAGFVSFDLFTIQTIPRTTRT